MILTITYDLGGVAVFHFDSGDLNGLSAYAQRLESREFRYELDIRGVYIRGRGYLSLVSHVNELKDALE